jgi:hypothetical protein
MQMNRSLRPYLALAVFGAALACAGPSALRAQAIPKGDLVIDLQPFATLPSAGNNRTVRANTLTTAPDGRLFVNDQRGPLYTVSADGAAVTLYLNVAQFVPLFDDSGERGFQSFAFHPDFNTPGAAGFGKFYTTRSQTDTSSLATFTPGVSGANRDHDEVLLEWTTSNPAAATFVPADAARPFREVLRIARPNGNHNGGFISFNPTAAAGNAERGNLYLGMGDSGGGGDPLNLAQVPGNAYGAILRINPLAPTVTNTLTSANGQYSISADNPFTTNPALLREKYAVGFRNPQRFTWDPLNGRLFIADIGQNRVEEIDIAAPGANYGWNKREGSFIYNSDGSIGANVRGDSASSGFIYPIAEYFHFGSVGNGVTTGPVYRGDAIPALKGRLLFSDFPSGTPYTLNADALPDGGQGGITELRLRLNGTEMSFLDMIRQVNPNATRADLRFGTDANENIYFLNKQDGIIRRVVTQTPPPPPPANTPVIGISVDAPRISRSAGEFATVTLTRTGDLSAELKVPYVLGGETVNGRDYAALKGVRKIKSGKSKATVKIVPLSGGVNGKTRFVIQPGDGYSVDPAARKVKVFIVD